MLTQGGDPMDTSLSSRWIHDQLEHHFSDEEMERIRAYMRSESWASPTSRKMWNGESPVQIPLRFHLDVDLKD